MVAPAAARVPAIEVLPEAAATVNLSELTTTLPATARLDPSVVEPATSRFPLALIDATEKVPGKGGKEEASECVYG